jgi:hypothetical protein
VRRSPWLLLVLLPACAGFQKPVENKRPTATLEQLKSDHKPVCATVANLSNEAWSAKGNELKPTLGDKMISSSVQACARIRPSASGSGEGAVVDLSFIFPQQDEHWRPEYWHVEVVRSNGVVVQAANLDVDRIEDGICVLDVCNKEGYATLVLDQPWEVGTYKIRLVHVPTRKHVDVVITLN